MTIASGRELEQIAEAPLGLGLLARQPLEALGHPVGVHRQVPELVAARDVDGRIELSAAEAPEPLGERLDRPHQATAERQGEREHREDARGADGQAGVAGDRLRARGLLERLAELLGVEAGRGVERLREARLLGLHVGDRRDDALARLVRDQAPR